MQLKYILLSPILVPTVAVLMFWYMGKGMLENKKSTGFWWGKP